MPASTVLIVFFAVLFSLMYWQAPSDHTHEYSHTDETKDPWDKLRHQIDSHRQHFAQPPVFRRPDAKPVLESASAPQLTEAHSVAESAPAEELVEPDSRPVVKAKPTIARIPSAKTSDNRRSALKHDSPRKRVVRITTYENGQPIRVRTFELPPSAHRATPNRRYYVPCPNAECRPIRASMFASDGRLN